MSMITKGSEPVLLLYSPLGGHGHLDGWQAMFAASLANRGHVVVCITPNAGDLSARLRLRGMDQAQNLFVAPWPSHTEEIKGLGFWRCFWKTVHYRWYVISNIYVNRLEDSRITKDMPILRRLRKHLLRLMVPPAYAVFDALRRACRVLIHRNDQDAIDIDEQNSGLLDPIDCARRIRQVMKNISGDRYFLFNLYMDMYRTDVKAWKNFARICKIPWAGIRFNPESAPSEAYYSLQNFRGMCFLGDAVRHAYAAALPDKCFATLPDVTDASFDAVPSALAESIKARAAGRKVVFMGGSIGPQKNILLWLEVIRRADPARFFFVQIGEIHFSALAEAEQGGLRMIIDAPPENFLSHDAYLPDERNFNSCMAACDFVFAVYRDFRNSSNMPSKAAAFEKPILVSNRWLMGALVEKYGLGETVPDNDPLAVLAALERLLEKPPPASAYAAYRADHSEEVTSFKLASFLDLCLSPGSNAEFGRKISNRR